MEVNQMLIEKLSIIDEGDINLEGESEDYTEGYRAGIDWVLDNLEIGQ